MEDIVEEPVIDIDSCDAKNPLAVVDYIEDLHAYYRKMEVKSTSAHGVNFLIMISQAVFRCPNLSSFTHKNRSSSGLIICLLIRQNKSYPIGFSVCSILLCASVVMYN